MGDLGPSLGWPVFMVGMIITSNVAALMIGEWSGTSVATRTWLSGGLVLLVGSIVLVGVASSVGSKGN